MIVLHTAQIYYNLFVKQNLRLNNSNLHEISPSTTVNIPQLFCGKSKNQCLNNVHIEHATTVSTDSNPHNQAFKHSNWQFNNRHHTILNRRIIRRRIEYVFSREDAGTYTCRARVPQTGITKCHWSLVWIHLVNFLCSSTSFSIFLLSWVGVWLVGYRF